MVHKMYANVMSFVRINMASKQTARITKCAMVYLKDHVMMASISGDSSMQTIVY